MVGNREAKPKRDRNAGVPRRISGPLPRPAEERRRRTRSSPGLNLTKRGLEFKEDDGDPRCARGKESVASRFVTAMAGIGRLRRTISSLILWGVFFCLYAGGAAILALGLFFTGKSWWTVLHQPAGGWPIFLKTAEVLFLTSGLLLALIIPFLQFRGLGLPARWDEKRRSGAEGKASPSA